MIPAILEYLGKGFHVVLEFGRTGNNETAYVLIANLLTRRIHETYIRRTEEAQGTGGQGPAPPVIAIEEAPKFLNSTVAGQTIFGTIAREMRKYGVTLLVIDQRPSNIDSEVLSQLGTKLTCLLDDDRDVDAVLAGVPGKSELRQILTRLDAKQQALVVGNALPMPIVVRTREYGSPESYQSLGFVDALESKKVTLEHAKDLFAN